MKNHDKSNILLIPDLHQDLRWARKILEKEADSSMEIIFMGDYWDSFNEPPAVATAGETADFLAELCQWPNVTFLLGNHDIPYLESWPYLDQSLKPHALNYPCPGYSIKKARAIHANLPFLFWKHAHLFIQRRGYLISHAGVHRHFWDATVPAPEMLFNLQIEGDRALDSLRVTAFKNLQRAAIHPIERLLRCPGSGRFNQSASPAGCTWLDWDSGFQDRLPFPQIVGHTSDVKGVRRKGRSSCIDGYQTCYGILQADGSLEVRYPDY